MFSYGNDLCVNPSVRVHLERYTLLFIHVKPFETILDFSREGNNGIFSMKASRVLGRVEFDSIPRVNAVISYA